MTDYQLAELSLDLALEACETSQSKAHDKLSHSLAESKRPESETRFDMDCRYILSNSPIIGA